VRTTVDIPDLIYRQLKGEAAREGTSVKKIILRGVVEHVRRGNTRKPSSKRVKSPVIPSNQPGTMRIDNAAIDDILSLP
jgi:hypothetical protein